MKATGAQLRIMALTVGLAFLAFSFSAIAGPAKIKTDGETSAGAPGHLTVDDLDRPMGLDDQTPHFSWQIVDGRHGARQTAYTVLVASSRELLAKETADIWDSGKVATGQSVGVVYKGGPLKPFKHYLWRVFTWDQDGKPYPSSAVGEWETGLLGEDWKAKWIGYQTWEEAAVRAANSGWVTTPDFAESASSHQGEQNVHYRLSFNLPKPVKEAFLFATGQDVATVWINGTQVAKGAALTPWKQMPWKKYVRTDVTGDLKKGTNLLAIQVTHYVVNPNGQANNRPPPMSATLVAEMEDGTIQSFATGTTGNWETSIHPKEDWMTAIDAGQGWKPATAYLQDPGPLTEPVGDPWPTQTVKVLRRDFATKKNVISARLYATALGSYEVFLNGKRAGDDVLAPGWTDYRLRLKYQTYDVTSAVRRGGNTIAALVAPGWYSTPLEWFQQPNVYGKTPPSLLAQLHLLYSDGSEDWITTDTNWKASQSNIVNSEIYDGETQDARRLRHGWNMPGFDDSVWKAADARSPDMTGIRIDGQDFQSIRVERELTAKAVTEPQPGVFIFDMGQNFSGVEKLRLRGQAGTDVRVRTGEILNSDGTLYTDNLRTAKSTDHFLLAGEGTEEFEPQFTYHGFRFLEITGLKGNPGLDAVRGVVFHTDAPFTAQLKTGSPLINSLWSNILWGQRSNFVGVPTDCPQRDERLGWTADAQVFWRTASFNMDLAAFSRKYAADVRGTQTHSGQGVTAGALFGIFAPGIATTNASSGAGWSDAGVIVPWTSWIQTGDQTIIAQNWDAMTKYLSAIERSNPDFLWKNNAGTPFGDWLSPEGPTRFALVATASWAYDLTLMRQMAHALGKDDEESRYAALFANIQKAFTKEFVRGDGFVMGADLGKSPFGVINNPDAKAKDGDTQTGYVLALNMQLVPEEMRGAVADRLVKKIEANHGMLGTGFLGTPYLLSVLTDTGHRDLAYRLLLNTDYPSWGYLVDHGATTMWERWNGDQMKNDPSMNSYNHYAYGAVADWIYRYAAGIDTTASDAGFHTINLHPGFDSQLESIDFNYPSPYGMIRSTWVVKDGTAAWTVTVPANASGLLKLTASEIANWKLDGKELSVSAIAKGHEGGSGYRLPAGLYHFEVTHIR